MMRLFDKISLKLGVEALLVGLQIVNLTDSRAVTVFQTYEKNQAKNFLHSLWASAVANLTHAAAPPHALSAFLRASRRDQAASRMQLHLPVELQGV